MFEKNVAQMVQVFSKLCITFLKKKGKTKSEYWGEKVQYDPLKYIIIDPNQFTRNKSRHSLLPSLGPLAGSEGNLGWKLCPSQQNFEYKTSLKIKLPIQYFFLISSMPKRNKGLFIWSFVPFHFAVILLMAISQFREGMADTKWFSLPEVSQRYSLLSPKWYHVILQ